MDPMELQRLAQLLQAHQMQTGGEMPMQRPPAMSPMSSGMPPGTQFSAGQVNQQPPSLVDQIPGREIPRPAYQPDTLSDMFRSKMLSGGPNDLRNLAMALGPAAQAAGGMGQMASMANRIGMPGRAPQLPMDAAEKMFDMSQGGRIDPRLALAGGAVGVPAAILGPDIYNIIQKLRQRGQ